MITIPSHDERCDRLLSEVLQLKLNLFKETANLLQSLALSSYDPLTLAVVFESDQSSPLPSKQWAELRRFLLSESSYAKDGIRAKLEEILENNSHLASCCRNPLGLARTISILGDEALSASPIAQDGLITKTVIDHLLARLFESEYQRGAYIHIYNLRMNSSLPVQIPNTQAEIVTIDNSLITRLTGEMSPTSFIHNVKAGNCFIRFTDNANTDESKLFQNYWEEAYGIFQTLAFMEYGSLELDYGIFYYLPHWVNNVHKTDLYLWGRPRWNVVSTPYVLTDDRLKKFYRYWGAYLKMRAMLREEGTLRQASELAGDYFESHHKRLKPEEQLIELVIAFEALFSPGKEGEHRFRIAQRAGILLGRDPSERQEIYKFIRRMYDSRSQLVHGGKSPFKDDDLDESHVAQLGEYLRQAILRLLVLQYRGYKDKHKVEQFIDSCAFDATLLEKLNSESDFEGLINELISHQQPLFEEGF